MNAKCNTLFRVLNTEPERFSNEQLLNLRNICDSTNINCEREKLLKLIKDYNGLLIGLKIKIDKEILLESKKLKFIATPTTGLNHIDTDFAASLGIKILSLKGENEFLSSISATAELTWGLLLALVRKIPAANEHVRQGFWDRNKFYGHELRSKTLGIIGYGRLGKMVANYGRSFGMNIIVHDIRDLSDENVQCVELSKLLESSDVITIHVPLSSQTINMIDTTLIDKIKYGTILINTSRGEILDEACILKSLMNGRLKGVATDVLRNETSIDPNWLKSSELGQFSINHNNLIITPHIGGVTFESVKKTNEFIINKIKKYVQNNLIT